MRSLALKDGRVWYGSALRLRRVLQGWSAEDVAARLGRFHGVTVDQSTVWRWEEGKLSPTVRKNCDDILRGLASLFDCSTLVFFRRPVITWIDENADASEDTQ